MTPIVPAGYRGAALSDSCERRRSVAQVVGMSLKDCERPIELLDDDYAGNFMGQRHFSQGKGKISLLE